MTTNDYLTLSELKASFPDTSWGTTYDTVLTAAITRASRLVDRYTNRKPGAYFVDTDETRYYPPVRTYGIPGGGYQGEAQLSQALGYWPGLGKADQLWIDELATTPTSVKVAETGVVDSPAGTGGTYTTWAITDYFCWPYNALSDGLPFQRLDINLLTGTKSVWYQWPRAVKITGKFGFALETPDDVKEAVLNQVFRWFKRSQQAMTDRGVNADLGEFVYRAALDPQTKEMIDHFRKQAI